MSPRERLKELFTKIFSFDELCRFISKLGYSDDFKNDMPQNCTLNILASLAVSFLLRRGHVNDSLFKTLREERPLREKDINYVEHAFLNVKKNLEKVKDLGGAVDNDQFMIHLKGDAFELMFKIRKLSAKQWLVISACILIIAMLPFYLSAPPDGGFFGAPVGGSAILALVMSLGQSATHIILQMIVEHKRRSAQILEILREDYAEYRRDNDGLILIKIQR